MLQQMQVQQLVVVMLLQLVDQIQLGYLHQVGHLQVKLMVLQTLTNNI